MSLTVHLALVFHVFIAVAVMVMVCGRRGHGLWPSWSWFVAVMVMVCGHHGHGLWPSWSWFVAIMDGHGLWPSWYRPLL